MKLQKIVKSTLIAMFVYASSVGIVNASAYTFSPFTQFELNTNWQADRQIPSGGVNSISAFGRENVAQLSVETENIQATTFHRTEGIKTAVSNFGTEIKVDLYIDPDWENKAVRAGFWVVGDDGSGARDRKFGIIEFINNELCDVSSCSNQSNITDHRGFRIWDSNTGWVGGNLNKKFKFGEWTTLGIKLDVASEKYIYSINGIVVGQANGGRHFIREAFLNSYNYGSDNFLNLNSENYSAHWHVGLLAPSNKDQCKQDGWETFTNQSFKNQGACVSYVEANAKANK